MTQGLLPELPALALVLLGCGASETVPVPSPGASGAEAPAAEPDLDALRALGYAGWDDAPADGASGVVRHDRERAWPGLNLYTDDVDRVLLIDMEGELVHAWRVPGRTACEVAELLDGGRVVVASVDEGVTLLESSGEVVWERSMNAHHDVTELGDGTFLVLEWEERPYRGRRVRFDRVVRLGADGRELGAWSTWEHREELQALHPPLALDRAEPADEPDDTVYDYYHLNGLAELGDTPLGRRDARFRAGNVLVGSRNASLVLVLDGDTFEPRWHFGPGVLDFPHRPTWVDEGRLLVFDNGWHRGWSRVLEVDPERGEVAWRYEAQPREAFFTKRRGSSQRLPNGNTLVCESERGRVFEVTRAGDVVWELRNPELRDGKRKRIYRMERVAPSRAAFADGR